MLFKFRQPFSSGISPTTSEYFDIELLLLIQKGWCSQHYKKDDITNINGKFPIYYAHHNGSFSQEYLRAKR